MKQVAKKKQKNQIDDCPAQDEEEKEHRAACLGALWRAMQPEEILRNLANGAETLSQPDFQGLVQEAWALFDKSDVVGWLLGQNIIGVGRLRPELTKLAALQLGPSELSKEPAAAASQLERAEAVLQHLISVCQADERLARVAALYGATFVAERAHLTANASIDLTS